MLKIRFFEGVVLLVLAAGLACGPKPVSVNSPVANAGTPNGSMPFSTKERDVYQAEAYFSTNGANERYFIARNGPTRRFDIYVGEIVALIEIVKDNNRYVIDHTRKLYYVEQSSDKGPKAIDPTSMVIFQNTQHREFDETGRDGDAVTYRAKKLAGDPDEDVTVTVDQKTGLMMREEVSAADQAQAFTFELKDVKLEAGDDLFQIPVGYKQVSKDEFISRSNANANRR